MAERMELGAIVEPAGQRAEAESGPWRLKPESRETPNHGDAGVHLKG